MGYCLLIHLFISFNNVFCLLMVIKYLKGFRFRSFLLQAVLSHIIIPVHDFMSICCFISFFCLSVHFLLIVELPRAGEDGLGRVCFGEI